MEPTHRQVTILKLFPIWSLQIQHMTTMSEGHIIQEIKLTLTSEGDGYLVLRARCLTWNAPLNIPMEILEHALMTTTRW